MIARARGGFPWASKTLAARAKHLAPMKLRIGGGAQSGDVYDKAFLTQKLPLITAMAQAMGAKLVWGTAPWWHNRSFFLILRHVFPY